VAGAAIGARNASQFYDAVRITVSGDFRTVAAVPVRNRASRYKRGRTEDASSAPVPPHKMSLTAGDRGVN
jgi:hypothetical protein